MQRTWIALWSALQYISESNRACNCSWIATSICVYFIVWWTQSMNMYVTGSHVLLDKALPGLTCTWCHTLAFWISPVVSLLVKITCRVCYANIFFILDSWNCFGTDTLVERQLLRTLCMRERERKVPSRLLTKSALNGHTLFLVNTHPLTHPVMSFLWSAYNAVLIPVC